MLMRRAFALRIGSRLPGHYNGLSMVRSPTDRPTILPVQWLDWSPEAFARAAKEHKPILLAISTTWCPCCVEMDRTSYADRAVTALINERFVPVRVDADERPDVSDRYDFGGWPTTAFLTPTGEVLGGGTYMPPARMSALLSQVADAFEHRTVEIAERTAGLEHGRSMRSQDAAPAASEADADCEAWLCGHIADTFDERFGGFGNTPKLMHAEALRVAIRRHLDTGDEPLRHIVTRTLDAMKEGGVWDAIDGGFFRYADARDWSHPHLEKLLVINAAALVVYLEAWEAFGRLCDRDRAIQIVRYVHGTLADVVDGGFYASQRADEAYYAAGSAETLRALAPPPVDRSFYADANAQMAVAYVKASRLLDDSSLVAFAVKSIERVALTSYERGAGIAHQPDAERSVRGLLADHVYVASALVDIYEAVEETVYLDIAQELMYYALRTMWDSTTGGFLDRIPGGPGELGLLRERVRPLVANCEAARTLARLGRLTGRDDLRGRAGETLAAQRRVCRASGLQGAAYALALREIRS